MLIVHAGLLRSDGAFVKISTFSLDSRAEVAGAGAGAGAGTCVGAGAAAAAGAGAGPATTTFNNLAELGRTLKNNVVHPVLRAAQVAAGLPETVSLLALMPEILNMVLGYLGPVELCAFAAASRQCYAMAQSPTLWRGKYTKPLPQTGIFVDERERKRGREP